nr:beta-eliminating lyase-related protein [Beutenbergia cavernae]
MPVAPVSFASDNYAPAHPEVLAALTEANSGHAVSYGEDPWTERLADVVRRHFGEHALAYPVLTGTGANVVALASVLPRWGGVLVSRHAHLHTDEAGAPEQVAGIKLLPVAAPDGRIAPSDVERAAVDLADVHRAQPLAVSLTQATELGTVYEPEALRAIADAAHARGMRVHVDGARLANAAAHLGVGLRELTTDAGVDVVSFGGTKNGLLLGEMVVVCAPDAVAGLENLRKQAMQLASKMRYVSAQLVALLDGDLWLRSARHANEMAALLRTTLDDAVASGRAPGLAFTQPTQANSLFATLPPGVADRLRARFRFYDWDAARREVRWMCAWDTTPGDVEGFAAAVVAELGAAGSAAST